jgi:hypothetical protein
MTAELTVNMDDVVSAFVATYENNLYKRKKELNRDIKDLLETLEPLDAEALDGVSGAEYDVDVIEPFGLRSKVEKKHLNWAEKEVVFEISVFHPEKARRSYYSSAITVKRTKAIQPSLVREHTQLEKDLNSTRAQLSEVLEGLKGITRKERQVRGKIAIRKLEDSGYANLMEDPELAQLVQLDD